MGMFEERYIYVSSYRNNIEILPAIHRSFTFMDWNCRPRNEIQKIN